MDIKKKGPETFEPIPGCYTKFRLGDEVVAYANLIHKEDSIYILNFEVREKGKGIGKSVIETYKTLYDVEGVSSENAKAFWLKMGAVMDNEGGFIIKRKGGKNHG